MYITYEEYQLYGGTLEDTAFNSTVYDAQVKIDWFTFNRLKNDTTISENVKRCMVKLIDRLYNYNEYIKVISDIKSPIIASQSNDGVSISYGGFAGHTSPSDMSTVENQLELDIKKIINQYLYGERNEAGDVLLYRGVYK